MVGSVTQGRRNPSSRPFRSVNTLPSGLVQPREDLDAVPQVLQALVLVRRLLVVVVVDDRHDESPTLASLDGVCKTRI